MKGQVAVFTGPMKALEIREYPLPEVGPDDILVKVHCANICGSDLHIWRGHGPSFPRNLSIVAGHEMGGGVFPPGKKGRTHCLGQPLEEGGGVAYAYFVSRGGLPARLNRP